MNKPPAPLSYNRGDKDEDKALQAVSAALLFWQEPTPYWVQKEAENLHLIRAASPFSEEEYQALLHHGLWPRHYFFLLTNRTLLGNTRALVGMMTTAVHNYPKAALYCTAALQLSRDMQTTLAEAKKRLAGLELQPAERKNMDGWHAYNLDLLVHHELHIHNVKNVAADAVAGHIEMPKPVDFIIADKLPHP